MAYGWFKWVSSGMVEILDILLYTLSFPLLSVPKGGEMTELEVWAAGLRVLGSTAADPGAAVALQDPWRWILVVGKRFPSKRI